MTGLNQKTIRPRLACEITLDGVIAARASDKNSAPGGLYLTAAERRRDCSRAEQFPTFWTPRPCARRSAAHWERWRENRAT